MAQSRCSFSILIRYAWPDPSHIGVRAYVATAQVNSVKVEWNTKQADQGGGQAHISLTPLGGRA